MKITNLRCFLMIVFFLSNASNVFPQNNDSIIHICKYPVKDGYAYSLKQGKLTSYQDPITFVPIFSKDSSVFAFNDGKVVTVYQKENFIVVRSKKSKKYISYSNLQKIIVKEGDEIVKGQILGFTKKSEIENYFRLNFKMTIDVKDISYEDQLKYLQRACSQ